MLEAIPVLLVIVAWLLFFIWKQLESIAHSLRGLKRIADDRNDNPQSSSFER